jgi:hypothetical protein
VETKQAFLHGARGVGLSNWEAIKRSTSLQDAFRSAVQEVKKERLDDFKPEGRIAIIYSPFPGQTSPTQAREAERTTGSEPKWSALSGYVPGWEWPEPTSLLLAFASGTKYGALDYVTESSLDTCPLDKYRVIIAPSTLYLSSSSANWLQEFVSQGGVLVADLGFGAYQSGTFNRLPGGLGRALFGINNLNVARAGGGNLIFARREAVALSIIPGEAAGRQGEPSFLGPMAEASIVPSTRVWATLRPFAAATKRWTRAGLLVHPWGKGMTVFATLQLWGQWAKSANSDPLFSKFHSDLIGPTSWALLRDEPFLPQDWEFLTSPIEIGIMNLADRERTIRIGLTSGIFSLFGEGVTNLVGPEGSPREFELAAKGGEAFKLAPTSITAFADIPTAITVAETTEKHVVLQIKTLGAVEGAVITLNFNDGLYQIAPGSRHILSFQGVGKEQTWLLQADSNRRVAFSAQVSSGRIILKPAPSPD